MKRTAAVALLALAGACAPATMSTSGATPIAAMGTGMSFFITSTGSGKGADLGGLAGADRRCLELATSVGSAGGRTWHAYLSTQGAGAVSARDRIGSGPWYNAKGVKIADNVADLHAANTDSTRTGLGKRGSLNERGELVNGRGDQPNRHDILTGSNLDGTAFTITDDRTCSNWTSSAATGAAQVGHHDRTGGGANPTSFNAAHPSRGCGQDNLKASGGDGLFYCFAL